MQKYLLSAFVILLSLPQCPAQKANPVAETKRLSTATEPTQPHDLYGPVVAANNRFAVNFFKAAFEGSSEENVLTAPASLSYAFALVLNGSGGAGRDQIADIFNFKSISLDQINQGNAALHQIRKSHSVEKPSSKRALGFSGIVGEDGRSFQPYRMAGALWVPNGAFERPFLSVNATSYGYTVFPRRTSAAVINRWASLNTHAKLQNIIQDIGEDDFVLTTVVDFKSRWVQPFSPSETHLEEFTLLSGAKKRVPMMPKHDYDFQYFKGMNFQALKLNFYDAAMVVVLPDEDSSLRAFVNTLTPDSWQTWSGQFGKHEGFLELPRFEITQERNSRLVLEKMGLTLPFSDFSTFTPLVGLDGATLTRVQEGASMKVDETGAEILSYGVVGGVIGGVCGGNCPPPPPPFHMIVNRPFFFWVVDTRTNQTLYMGTVVKP